MAHTIVVPDFQFTDDAKLERGAAGARLRFRIFRERTADRIPAAAWGEADATVAAFLSFEEEHAGCELLLVPADKPEAEAAVLRAGLGLQRLQMYRLASQAYFSEQQMEQTCSTLERGLLIGDQLRPLFEAAKKVDEATLPESMRGLGEKVAQEANRIAGFFVFAQATHCTASGSGE